MPPCSSVAFYDRNLGYLHLGMVEICRCETAWQIATKSLNATPREILQHDKTAFAEARC